MVENGQQLKMGVSRSFPAEKMGIRLGSNPHHLFMHRGFMGKIGQLGFPGDLGRQPGDITDVECPFCKEGRLKVLSVQPVYSGGARSVPVTQQHVGNQYAFVCSNDKCDGRFFGTHQWLWID